MQAVMELAAASDSQDDSEVPVELREKVFKELDELERIASIAGHIASMAVLDQVVVPVFFPFTQHDQQSQHLSIEDFQTMEGSWWLGRTKSREEKQLAAALTQQGVPYILPMQRTRTRQNSTVVDKTTVVFPGYIFLYLDTYSWYKAHDTHRLSHAREIENQAEVSAELEMLIIAMRTTSFQRRSTDAPVKGRYYRVYDGPLKGLEGKLVTINRKTSLVLLVKNAGNQYIEVQVDISNVEAV